MSYYYAHQAPRCDGLHMSYYAHQAPTDLSSLLSATHGRDRREERCIQKIDLQRARRYGMKEAGRYGREKYTYGGIVFIYDPVQNREVTSYKSQDISLRTSGTRFAQPVLLDKRLEYEHPAYVAEHNMKHKQSKITHAHWTSHSVLVIDMSGSMRRDDVNGAKCRSDGVWMALARDYVKSQLEKKTRTSTDLISVIIMKGSAELVMETEPIDWCLYNKLLDMREWITIRPEGPGNYMPALEKAEKMLLINTGGSCALSLLFFSDGKPSDRGDFKAKMGKIASKFGRRLSISCIGMAEEGEDFSTLYEMVEEAKSYGAVATFGKPSLDADSLSHIITSLASSLTTSKTEMTELATGKSKTVRMDVRREKFGTPDDVCVTDEWHVYLNESVLTVMQWSYEHDTFVEILDTRCWGCWTFVPLRNLVHTCSGCHVIVYCCLECKEAAQRFKNNHDCASLRSLRKEGRIVTKELPSFSVAMRKTVFGEGAERMVSKFRFLDPTSSNYFVGDKMVAKESRFVELNPSSQNRMHYHSEFMRTQAIASKMALKFNEAIDALMDRFLPSVRVIIAMWPRISFLSPIMVKVETSDRTNQCFLVEPMLHVEKYEKFNNNMGYVKGQKREVDLLASSMANLGLDGERVEEGEGDGLGAIEEGGEEEDSEDDEDGGEDLFESSPSTWFGYCENEPKDEDFPAAFSHFSFEMSKGSLMVVDLQGVFKVRSDGTRVYELTDPVIHKKESRRQFRKWTFGRTDRGKKGMRAFFLTHKCSDVCKLLDLKTGMV